MQFMWQRKDNMKVTGLKQFLLPGIDPSATRLSLTLVAVPIPAAVVGDDRISATLRTNIDMAAQGRSAAPPDGLDRFQLLKSDRVIVDEIVGMSTEDIGYLDGRPAHWFFLGRRLGLSPSPEIGK